MKKKISIEKLFNSNLLLFQSPPDYYRVENDAELSSLSVRDRYNVSILKHVQAIFAHLGHSALQFYVPRGLWSQFK